MRTDNMYSSHKLVTTLAEMNMCYFDGCGYVPIYTRSELTDELHIIFDFKTDYRIIEKKKINEIISYTKNSRSSKKKRANKTM